MDAMILAAGVGSRLGAITEQLPKALVEVAGIPMLERVARKLIAAGVDRLVINVHHHAAQIVEFVERRGGFGVEVLFSPEYEEPLETGGGILNAAALFRRHEPFFLHNVDVLSEVDLRALYGTHLDTGALASLVVHERETTRLLLFSEDGLCGRLDRRGGQRAEVHASYGEVRALAFAGIHVASPALLGLLHERGRFSIIDTYLRLAGEGHRIGAFETDARWLEIGTPERLAATRAVIEREETEQATPSSRP